jgi:hypothetical protein
VSKTFKALQRAAAEQARRLRREPDAVQTAAPGGPPPSAAMARLFAVTHPPTPAPPRPATVAGAQTLRSEMDLHLRELLEGSFRASCPTLSIQDDGWVQGQLDREALRALCRRHALLHCLRKSETESFWFWGSAREALDLAEATGFPLDAED